MTPSLCNPSNRCMPLAEWPAPDQAAWVAAVQPEEGPGQTNIAAHWAAGTRRAVASGYGRWLTWLAEQE